MGANRVGLLVMGMLLGCTETAIRPPALPCPDGSSCVGANPNTAGVGTASPDGGAAMDGGLGRYNVAGSVVVLDQIPPTATVTRTGVGGWTIRSVDDPTTAVLTNGDGTFTLTGVLPTLGDGGVPVIGLRAMPISRATFGVFREVRAGGGSVTLETFGSERVLEAVAGQGGAPSSDLGHVVVVITEASDPSVGVVGAVVNASSAATTFYDSDLIPGQLTPSVAGTGRRGFAIVLNVPAGDDANGGSVTLQVQVPGATPVPGSVTVRVFPNTITWTAVRVTR